jgi:chromosome segregation protein
VMNTITALNAAVDAAAHQRDRAAEALSRLEAEASDLRTEHARATSARVTAAEALRRAQDELESARVARVARESELASARFEHEWRARDVRAREHDLAAMTARLTSLEELDAHRAGYGDAARLVLAQANGEVNQLGALADYLEVEPRYERAVEACLGDLLQHVLVARHEHARAGLEFVRREDAGRCGFIVVDEAGTVADSAADTAGMASPGVRLSSVIRLHGPYGAALRAAVGDAWIVESYDEGARLAGRTPLAVATLDGDVFPGSRIVEGGGKAESRGILATKREIKDLRERVALERAALARLSDETATFEQAMAHATAGIAALTGEQHRPGEGDRRSSRRSCSVQATRKRCGCVRKRRSDRARVVETAADGGASPRLDVAARGGPRRRSSGWTASRTRGGHAPAEPRPSRRLAGAREAMAVLERPRRGSEWPPHAGLDGTRSARWRPR